MVATRPDNRLRAKSLAPPPDDGYRVRLQLSAARQGVGGLLRPHDFRRGLEYDSAAPAYTN
jgi:hypothetical protein